MTGAEEPVPGIAEANAVVDGTVRAEGSWDTLALEGGLDVRDGAARIISMGQHLRDAGGAIRFVGNRIVIPEDRPFVAYDGDRSASLDGEALLHGLAKALVRGGDDLRHPGHRHRRVA